MLQVTPKEHKFVMRGGASKKYPRVTVVCDAKTKWDGLNAASKSVKVGDPVRVTCAHQKDGSFRATAIFKINPHEKPRMAGAAPGPGGSPGATGKGRTASGSSRPAGGNRRSGPGRGSRPSTGNQRR